jgi:hypothetical protein
MGHFKIAGFNCHVAKDPVFFAAPLDPNADDRGRSKNKCVVTVIANRGTSKNTGKDITTAIDLEFWGGYAEVAATQLTKGRCIEIIDADLVDFLRDTKVVDPDGNNIKFREHSIRVNRFEFGGNTMKEMVATVNMNMRRAVAEGLLPADCSITAEYLLASNRPKTQEFSRDKIVNGKFGYAKVWDRATGAWAEGGAGNEADHMDELARLRAENESLKKSQGSAPENGEPVAVAAEVVNPAAQDEEIPF